MAATQTAAGLEVIVTSGGTISKIDDVRHIGNFSRGTTGARIAEEFLENGARVHYVHGRGADRPFRQSLVVDPDRPLDEELEKVRRGYELFQSHAEKLKEYEAATFDEYHRTVKELLTGTGANVIVLAAAVGDYGGTTKDGKISSDEDMLKLELPRNPKVISLVKDWSPGVFLVGFKLLSRATPEELVETAYRHATKNKSDLTVANTLVGGDPGNRKIFIVTPEKEAVPVTVEDLAPTLVETVVRRVAEGKAGRGA